MLETDFMQTDGTGWFSLPQLFYFGAEIWRETRLSSFAKPVASLGWVTPGAATEGVTPLEGVTPHLFYLSDLVSPLFFANLPTNVFPSGVTYPLEGVTRGGPPSPAP